MVGIQPPSDWMIPQKLEQKIKAYVSLHSFYISYLTWNSGNQGKFQGVWQPVLSRRF